MKYNINFEVCALVFLLVIASYFFAKRKYVNLTGKIYSFYVLFVFFNIIASIVSIYFIADADKIPLVFNYIVNEIYNVSQLILPYILLIYILSFTPIMKKKTLIISFVPAFVGVILMIFNPFTHFFFYFNENFQYVRGVGNIYLYTNVIVYVIISFIIVMKYRKRIGPALFLTCHLVFIIMLAGMIYQYFYPENIIIGTGAVLIQLMLYLAMENPDIYGDALTGALNEKALHEKGAKSYLIIISLRDFKLINDVFGRKFGDSVLKKIADYLISETDKQRVFRIYGDVFIVLADNEDEGFALSTKFKERISKEWSFNHISVRLSARLGLMKTKGYQNNERLYAMLEHAINEMKKKDSKSLYVVDEVEKEKLVRKTTILRGIADIISKGHIEMAYQPIYDINGKLFALESLARMNLVKYGYVSPEEFIKMSEINGSIYRLGNVIINEVLNFVDENRERFENGLSIGINISVIQIMRPTFAKMFLDILKERNVPCEWLVIEVTESEAIYSDPTVMENLLTLKKAGLRLAMDDYGTGYASINNLIDIPFKTIKLDKQVIWNSMQSRKAKVILVNTVRMLQQLDFRIVAEGIETEDHLEQMRRLMIDLYQGYYYTKPLSRYDIWNEVDKIEQQSNIKNN